MDLIFTFLGITPDQHQMIILILAGLFSFSEALAHIPAIKANGVFQLIFGLLGKLTGKDPE